MAKAVERWFAKHQRPLPWRQSYDSYYVWLSEVMLQQTRMEVVLRYFDRFLSRFPTVAALAAADEQEVLTAWSGLGYYRRARMLHQGARTVMARHGGLLPKSVEQLRAIPGIGRYTAGAIASIAFNRRAPIVDGNIARLLARLRGWAWPVASAQLMGATWKEMESLAASCSSPRRFNQGLMEIGALICRPAAPACGQCPLRTSCAAFATDRTEALPIPRAARKARLLEIPLYLIRNQRGHLLLRRERGTLMTDMFHLPHGNASLFTAPRLRVSKGKLLGTFQHTVTTRSIRFRLYAATLERALTGGEEYRWIDPHRIAEHPHPSYVRKALGIAAALQSPHARVGDRGDRMSLR